MVRWLIAEPFRHSRWLLSSGSEKYSPPSRNCQEEEVAQETDHVSVAHGRCHSSLGKRQE